MNENFMDEAVKTQIGTAIDNLVRENGGYKDVAARAGIGLDTLYNWGKGTEPKLFGFMDLLGTLGVVDAFSGWSAGLSSDEPKENQLAQVPVYDVRLSAGHGALNEIAEVKLKVPFNVDYLQKLSGSSEIRHLAMFEARGESMSPTIEDRDLVMVNLDDKKLCDDIFAFVLHGEARIKRFQVSFDGLSIISDNTTLYPAETLDMAAANDLQIIGRVIWRMGQI